MEEISSNVSRAYRAKAEFTYKRYYPSLVNDSDFTKFVKDTATDLLGASRVITLTKPTMGADAFAFFLKKTKGAYISLNNLKPYVDGCTYPHHSSKIDNYDKKDVDVFQESMDSYGEVSKPTVRAELANNGFKI